MKAYAAKFYKLMNKEDFFVVAADRIAIYAHRAMWLLTEYENGISGSCSSFPFINAFHVKAAFVSVLL